MNVILSKWADAKMHYFGWANEADELSDGVSVGTIVVTAIAAAYTDGLVCVPSSLSVQTSIPSAGVKQSPSLMQKGWGEHGRKERRLLGYVGNERGHGGSNFSAVSVSE